jgi:hypothetical protein
VTERLTPSNPKQERPDHGTNPEIRDQWAPQLGARDLCARLKKIKAAEIESKSSTEENDNRGSKNRKSKSAPLNATRRNLAGESERSKQD